MIDILPTDDTPKAI
ncbi:unnamed protein product, partial [Rotaria magnacalcarata]